MSTKKQQVPVEKLFKDMTRHEKLCFIGKACIFFISGGFVYPTLWID